jgi:hypothetical protein
MFLVREVMYCKPGQVKPTVEKFKALAAVVKKAGYSPFRIYTDVSGEQFWTIVLESEAADLGAYQEMEQKVMGMEDAQKAMAGYHDHVTAGRREIYKVEA